MYDRTWLLGLKSAARSSNRFSSWNLDWLARGAWIFWNFWFVRRRLIIRTLSRAWISRLDRRALTATTICLALRHGHRSIFSQWACDPPKILTPVDGLKKSVIYNTTLRRAYKSEPESSSCPWAAKKHFFFNSLENTNYTLKSFQRKIVTACVRYMVWKILYLILRRGQTTQSKCSSRSKSAEKLVFGGPWCSWLYSSQTVVKSFYTELLSTTYAIIKRRDKIKVAVFFSDVQIFEFALFYQLVLVRNRVLCFLWVYLLNFNLAPLNYDFPVCKMSSYMWCWIFCVVK